MGIAHEVWEILPLPPDTYRYVFAKSKTGSISGTWLTGPARLERWMALYADHDCYIQLNPTRSRTLVRPRASDISHLQAILIDIDPAPHMASLDLFPGVAPFWINLLEKDYGVPSESISAIRSGRGVQLWLHVEPIPIVGTGSLARAVRAFVNDVARNNTSSLTIEVVDTACSDLGRLARLPGTVNTKTGQRAELLSMGIPVPALWLFPFDSDETTSQIVDNGVQNPRTHWPDVASAITHAAYDYIVNGVEEPGRHKASVACARSLREACVPPENALEYLMLGAGRCTPALKRSDVHRIWRDHFERRT